MHWGLSVSMRDETFKLTLKEYLEHYSAQVPECPVPPMAVSHIWEFWNRIRARTPAGESVNPITFESIEAFIRMTGEEVTPDDVTMLEAIDNAYIAQVAEERNNAQERQRDEAKSK